jgi:copper chaperone CopZ
MIHTYQLTGMTCTSCEAKVKSSLERVENVTKVEVSKEDSRVTISMDRHISLSDFQKVLDAKYTISAIEHIELESKQNLGFKPILLFC